MDIDQGSRRLAGLVLDTAGRGDHDQVTDLIAALDADELRSLVMVLAVQVGQTMPASSGPRARPPSASWPSAPPPRCSAPPRRRS